MNKDKFKQELKELLQKYQYSIGFSCGEFSDLHGVYDEKVNIYDKTNRVILSENGWELDSNSEFE